LAPKSFLFSSITNIYLAGPHIDQETTDLKKTNNQHSHARPHTRHESLRSSIGKNDGFGGLGNSGCRESRGVGRIGSSYTRVSLGSLMAGGGSTSRTTRYQAHAGRRADSDCAEVNLRDGHGVRRPGNSGTRSLRGRRDCDCDSRASGRGHRVGRQANWDRVGWDRASWGLVDNRRVLRNIRGTNAGEV